MDSRAGGSNEGRHNLPNISNKNEVQSQYSFMSSMHNKFKWSVYFDRHSQKTKPNFHTRIESKQLEVSGAGGSSQQSNEETPYGNTQRVPKRRQEKTVNSHRAKPRSSTRILHDRDSSFDTASNRVHRAPLSMPFFNVQNYLSHQSQFQKDEDQPGKTQLKPRLNNSQEPVKVEKKEPEVALRKPTKKDSSTLNTRSKSSNVMEQPVLNQYSDMTTPVDLVYLDPKSAPEPTAAKSPHSKQLRIDPTKKQLHLKAKPIKERSPPTFHASERTSQRSIKSKPPKIKKQPEVQQVNEVDFSEVQEDTMTQIRNEKRKMYGNLANTLVSNSGRSQNSKMSSREEKLELPSIPAIPVLSIIKKEPQLVDSKPSPLLHEQLLNTASMKRIMDKVRQNVSIDQIAEESLSVVRRSEEKTDPFVGYRDSQIKDMQRQEYFEYMQNFSHRRSLSTDPRAQQHPAHFELQGKSKELLETVLLAQAQQLSKESQRPLQTVNSAAFPLQSNREGESITSKAVVFQTGPIQNKANCIQQV